MELSKLLKLNLYKDDSFTEIERTVEVDKIKIPYRTAVLIIGSLDQLKDGDEESILNFITHHTELMDKIVKATFGVGENDLDKIDIMELVTLIRELFTWAKGKMHEIAPKNAEATA